jgi:hypothetical protein
VFELSELCVIFDEVCLDTLPLERQTKFNCVLTMHVAVTCTRTSDVPFPSLLTPRTLSVCTIPSGWRQTLSKRVWPLRAKDLLLVGSLWYTMRKREFQALRDELLDVWTFDQVG